MLHLNDRLSQRGGADLHLLGIIKELKRDTEQILLYGDKDKDVPIGIEHHPVDGLNARNASQCDFSSFLEDFNPDIIHVHNVMNPRALEAAAQNNAMMTVQDHRSFCPGRGKLTLDEQVCREPMAPETCESCFTEEPYFRKIYDVTRARLEAILKMRGLIVLSDYMRDELIQVGAKASRVSVIPPFAHSLEDPNHSNDEPCVLFVGRLVATKGIKDVIRAWELSGTNLPLVIAGAGPERGQINNPNIEWVGWLNPRELSGLYRRAKALLIAPRWQEPFGIVGLEAKSFGLPVVTWESGGVAEWNPEVLVPWGDVQALSTGLAKVLEGGIKTCPTKRGNITTNMRALRNLYLRTIRID